MRLSNFKKSFSRVDGTNAPSLQDRIALLPTQFKSDDWQEQLLYVYFALNYFDEQLFNVIIKRVNKFRGFEQLAPIFALNEHHVFFNLTSTDNLSLHKLNQLAFEAALDKDYVDIAFHFIQSSQVTLTW